MKTDILKPNPTSIIVNDTLVLLRKRPSRKNQSPHCLVSNKCHHNEFSLGLSNSVNSLKYSLVDFVLYS